MGLLERIQGKEKKEATGLKTIKVAMFTATAGELRESLKGKDNEYAKTILDAVNGVADGDSVTLERPTLEAALTNKRVTEKTQIVEEVNDGVVVQTPVVEKEVTDD